MINFKKILALLLLAISTCMYAQLPLASPSVSGKVVTPALNSTTGTQGGGLWVNVVDKATNLVVAKVSVGSTGDFTIPTGNLVETYNYDFILSKNEGTVGSPAPAKELNVGWIIVEEGISSTTPDGVANSIFNWTAGAANLTGVRFAIKTNPCSIGTDSDGDGIADECDLDDDNDGITDCDENLLGANASVSNVFSFITAGTAVATSNNEVRLTQDTGNQAGQIWSVGKVDFTKSFVLRFDAYLGTHDGADGIAAVFHNSPQGVNATGATGLGIGARGIANGIVLELDTYNNGTGLGDMSSDHGQIWDSDNQSSTGFLTTAIALPELENGNWHPVVINWNATTKTISYTVDGTNAGTYTGDLVTNYFAGANKVYFGYTASTGGATNEQKIRINSFCSDLPLELDKDGDGTPNSLDLDSDGDGCFDAIEGGDNVTAGMLNGIGRINVAANGTTTPVVVDANGVPVVTNTGSTFNVDGQAQGQTIGQSQINNPAAVAGTVGSNQTIVSGSAPSALSLTGSTGTIQWQSSTDNVTFANISGATSASYSPGTMTSTTYYRAVVSSLGGCSVNTNSVVITVFSNTDSDGDGIPDSTDLDDDNDGILDTTEGQCINTSNPSTDGFDSPLVATVNGNNIQSTNPYNGWGAETGGANAFNVIRVNGAGYASGPDNAQSGNQYIDITATSAYVYKNITLTSPAVFSGSAWFANRESSRGGYAPWSTKIEIRNETTGITVAQGNTINFTSSISDEIWNNSSINSVALPAGTYRIRMYVGDFGHLDSISYCFSKDTDNDGTPNYLDLDSDGDGCPDAIEGGDNITQTMLNGSNAIGSNISGTLNSPAIATVDAYGVPVITNTGSTFNVDGQAQGQTVNQAYTVNPAAVVAVSPVTHPTCSVATGSFTITNYNATNTYTFVPAGPTIDASGVVTASTGSYTLTASANGCTSASVSVTVNAQPATPATPTIGSVTQPTCSVANGTFVITNYSSANTYSITSPTGTVVSGPTATGLVTTTAGVYTITASANGCTSAAVNVTINAQPVTPAVPTVSPVTHPTCSVATGSFTITNYNATNTYTFVPAGPTIDASGVVTASTGSYTLTASANGCTSAAVNVTVNAQPVTPTTPTIGSVTQPTCSVANGSFTITNYSSANTYSITSPTGTVVSGPTATGLVTTTAGVYTITASANGCTSASVSVTVNAQPATPATPTVGSVIQPTCSVANGTFVITNYSSANTYSITSPTGTVVSGPTATGLVTVTEGVYTITANANGCTSAPVNVTINAQPVTPAVPTVSPVTHPTCSVATGSFTITNYNATNTYTFVPAGPTIDASGVVTASTGSYTLTASANGCTSAAVNVTVNAQPVTPAVPTVSPVTHPTCSVATGSFTITNYNATNTYTFVPAGPTIDASGVVTASTGSYTLTASANGCTSASVSVTVNAQPATPATPTVGSVIQPTCSVANGTFVITNYSSANTYSITSPTGTVVSGPTATGLVTVTEGVYTITANANGCTSAPVNVTINAQPVTPAVPTVSPVTHPTCSVATGSFTITNYNATNTYTFVPAGPTIDASGVVTASTGSYTLTASANGCTSASVSVTVNAQPVTPTTPTIGSVTQPTCSVANGSFTITNYSSANTYSITSPTGTVVSGPTATGLVTVTAGSYTVTSTSNGCTSAPVVVVINPLECADIVTVKTDNQTSYVAGQPVTYVITVTNNGPTAATNVNVVDNAPAGTTFTSWSSSNGSGTGNINDTIATLAVGQTVTYTVNVDVPATLLGNLENTVTVTTTTPDPVPGCTTCTDIDTPNTTLAENDINNTFMNIPVSGSVLTNDSDPQGHAQTVTASTTTTPEGTLVLNANGTYTFTPATGFTGTFVHTYTVCDNGTPQACDTATLTIEVLPIVSTTNDVVANNDTATTSVDQPVTINILSNDFDPNGDTIGTPTIVTPPSNGTFDPLTGVYIPNPGFVGVDTFVYQICDDGTPQACDTAVVTITIVPTNITNETYANDDAYNGNGPTITGNILNNDTDPEGNTQFVTSNTQPQHGTVVVNLDGTFVYTPTPGYYGPDSFVYTICDNGTPQACDTATVYLTVNAAPAIVITKDSSLSGNVITYTYLVTNTGNVPLTGVSVLETAANFSGTGTLPNPVYVSSNPSAGSSATSLAVGATSTYTATYTLTQADIDAGQVDNLATASGIDPTGVTVTDDSSDPTPCPSCTPVDPTCTDCTIVEIEQQPSIAIVKEATFNDNNGDGFPQAGETITYTFTVTNTGNMSLFDVIVTDPLPGIVLTGGPIDLAVGQSDSTTFTATYTITQADIVFGSVVNQATASAETIDGEVVDDLSDDDSELEDDPTIVILEGCKLTIFNAVSPNGDGSNDIFYIQGIECYPNNTVEVYNRWGIKVYEVNNYDNISNVFKGYSDGRVTISRNELLPTGTYFYIIKYVDLNGNGIDKSGYLYIQSN